MRVIVLLFGWFAAVFSVPLVILNALGAIVAGIWLGLLGEWSTLGWGIAALFLSFGISLVLMPTLLFAQLGLACAEKKNNLGLLCFGILTGLYVAAVMTAWCSGVFFFFMNRATHASFIPILIWSYSAAIGPWAHMAYKEMQCGGSGFDASINMTFFAAVAYIVIMFLVLFTSVTGLQVIMTFVAFMLVAIIIQLAITFAMMREERRQPTGTDEDKNLH